MENWTVRKHVAVWGSVGIVVILLIAGLIVGGPVLGRWLDANQLIYDRQQAIKQAENNIEVARLQAEKVKIEAENSGQAALLRAENEKKVMIETARAELEAAEFRAQAIEVMGEMASQFPEYRNQEFIAAFAEAIQSGAVEQIIYVPTEANIPIVEAGRTAD